MKAAVGDERASSTATDALFGGRVTRIKYCGNCVIKYSGNGLNFYVAGFLVKRN